LPISILRPLARDGGNPRVRAGHIVFRFRMNGLCRNSAGRSSTDGLEEELKRLTVLALAGGTPATPLTLTRRGISYISCLIRKDKGHCARLFLCCARPAAPFSARRFRPCAPVRARGASCAGKPLRDRRRT